MIDLAPPSPDGIPAAAQLAAETACVRSDRLRRHSFSRDQPASGPPGLLLGNGSLGGCLAPSGLGIHALWSAGLWRNTTRREAVKGPMPACDAFSGLKRACYHQELSLTDGLARTSVRHEDGSGYDAEVFCSMADPSLLVIRVTHHGPPAAWNLEVPWTRDMTQHSPTLLASGTDAARPCLWSLHADRPLTRAAGCRFTFQMETGATATFRFRLLDGKPASAGGHPDFESLLDQHRAAWGGLWDECAVLAIPDPELERLWYRALYWTISTCGDAESLPGESMFAVPCWDMHPFTYGAAGWGAAVFTAVGLPDRAAAMLRCHFKPAALRANADYYTHALIGAPAHPDALAFAHEVDTAGHNIPCGQYEMQRHLDGFAATLFHQHRSFYPDRGIPAEDYYLLLKGLAEFWCGLAHRDSQTGGHHLPGMTSLTEDLIAPHPIDAALAAQWCLFAAHRQAVAMNRDITRREHWREVAEGLTLPQNADRYLEFIGDPDRRGGGGYQGVRGFVYLGYPTIELIPGLDRAKAMRTLDHTWQRNRRGEGMIGFVANWFALADLHYGRGDHALEILYHNSRCLDANGHGVSEYPGGTNHHFTTNYASYVLVPLAMAIQSHEGAIKEFPAVPAAWRDFAFYQVPAAGGIRVSGVMRDGEVKWTVRQSWP